MHRYITYILLFCAVLVTGSCDFLRRSAGRPTSADIEIRRRAIESAEARKKAVEDSLVLDRELRLAYAADSVAVMDSLSRMGCLVRTQSETGRVQGPLPDGRYWIVTGAFRKMENASRRRLRLEEAGFECGIVTFGSGMNVVLAAPNDSLTGLYKDFKRYRSSGLSTVDVWIFDSEKSTGR